MPFDINSEIINISSRFKIQTVDQYGITMAIQSFIARSFTSFKNTNQFPDNNCLFGMVITITHGI